MVAKPFKSLSCGLSTFVLVTAVTLLTGVSAQTGNPHTITRCFTSSEDMTLQCKSTENIEVISVGFAYTPNCTQPAQHNECKQISADLTSRLQEVSKGKSTHTVPVLNISAAQSYLDQEHIAEELANCGVDGTLVSRAPMNLMEIKYQCREYTLCEDIPSSVADLPISTKGYPEKIPTTATCNCTYESMNPQLAYLTGYAQCHGKVVFVVTSTALDGTKKTLEYTCDNMSGIRHMVIGFSYGSDLPQASRLAVNVDVEKSDKESAYTISWFNVYRKSDMRDRGLPIKVNCSRVDVPGVSKNSEATTEANIEGFSQEHIALTVMVTVVPFCATLFVAAMAAMIYFICKKRTQATKKSKTAYKGVATQPIEETRVDI